MFQGGETFQFGKENAFLIKITFPECGESYLVIYLRSLNLEIKRTVVTLYMGCTAAISKSNGPFRGDKIQLQTRAFFFGQGIYIMPKKYILQKMGRKYQMLPQ